MHPPADAPPWQRHVRYEQAPTPAMQAAIDEHGPLPGLPGRDWWPSCPAALTPSAARKRAARLAEGWAEMACTIGDVAGREFPVPDTPALRAAAAERAAAWLDRLEEDRVDDSVWLSAPWRKEGYNTFAPRSNVSRVRRGVDRLTGR